jgi:hypothetical protein
MTPAALAAVSDHYRTDGLAGDHQVGCQLDIAAADSEPPRKSRQARHSRCRGGRSRQPSPPREHLPAHRLDASRTSAERGTCLQS